MKQDGLYGLLGSGHRARRTQAGRECNQLFISRYIPTRTDHGSGYISSKPYPHPAPYTATRRLPYYHGGAAPPIPPEEKHKRTNNPALRPSFQQIPAFPVSLSLSSGPLSLVPTRCGRGSVAPTQACCVQSLPDQSVSSALSVTVAMGGPMRRRRSRRNGVGREYECPAGSRVERLILHACSC